MHVRVSSVTRNGKTYQYAQIVESFRRPGDGMPAHRVVANLGNLERVDVQNLRDALVAAREGKRVVVARAPRQLAPAKPSANLRYLDLAVLLEVWRAWKLDEILATVLPGSEAQVPLSAVVCSLVLQRCVAPSSKLQATRWLPTTALPELLSISPSRFNNTRVHRVLDALEESTDLLMPRLASRYCERDGAFVALFLDVTDTWFVGHGPARAEFGKTKEGFVRRKIGIVLMCNERGYPLRWEVVSGRAADCTTMGAMLRSVAGLNWLDGVPVVCDRAMGKTAQLRELLATKLHFVTALTTPEFDAYAPQIPITPFTAVEPPADAALNPDARKAAVAHARKLALAAGLKQEEDNLLVLDIGVVERVSEEALDVQSGSADTSEDLTIVAMRHCRDLTADLAAGRHQSMATAGRTRGLSKGLASKYWSLRALPDALQRRILDGEAVGHALSDLMRIARLRDSHEQRRAFDALVSAPSTARPPRQRPTRPQETEQSARESSPVRVRAVIYFNPDRFVDARLRGRELRARVQRFVEETNRGLASVHSRMKPPQIIAAIDRYLRKDDLIEAFRCEVHTDDIAGRERHQVTLTLNETVWARRRRYDGFSVVVAHPDVTHTGPALCHLYRDKDMVEKDFQTIKSVIELRPVHHRDDDKVRAHVTLCMLALLLERTLHHQLKGLHSARAALEILSTTHLNRYATGESPAAYLVTHTNEEQDKILRRLRFRRLALDEDLAARITPR